MFFAFLARHAFLACLAYTMLYALCAMPSVIAHCPYLIDQPAQTYASCFRTNVPSFIYLMTHLRIHSYNLLMY